MLLLARRFVSHRVAVRLDNHGMIMAVVIPPAMAAAMPPLVPLLVITLAVFLLRLVAVVVMMMPAVAAMMVRRLAVVDFHWLVIRIMRHRFIVALIAVTFVLMVLMPH